MTEQAQRKPVPYTQTWGRGSHLRKTEPFEPGTVCGFLTVVEQLGSGRYTRFRCRCGAEVTRFHADVREAVGKGQVPACIKCRSAALASKKGGQP
jgi:hypothetical protein